MKTVRSGDCGVVGTAISPKCGVCGIDGVEVAVDIDAEVGEPGSRGTKKMADPRMPTPTEIDEHNKTHLLYRNWCSLCMKGRGKEMPHTKVTSEHSLSEIHLDFMFVGPKGAPGDTLPCLVAREALTKMTMSAAVPSKSTGTYIAKRVIAFLREIGCEYNDLIVKSDQEPAIVSVISEVARLRAMAGGGKFIVEASPVGSSASNGVAERAIQSVEAQVRVLKLAVETRWGVEIPAKHPILPWLVEYSAFLLNRFEVGHDGKTAYERLKGKQARTLGVEFAEAILWKSKPSGGALGKLSSLWDDGIFLGVRGKSGEIIVGSRSGVKKARTIQRRPVEERWKASAIELVSGVPWRTCDDDPNVDGEKLEAVKLSEFEAAAQREVLHETVPKRFRIEAKDLDAHGYSAKCPGCSSVLRGTVRQGHSEGCRKRFSELLKDDEKVIKVNERMHEFLAKALEKDDMERVRKRDCAANYDTMKAADGASSSGACITAKDRKRPRDIATDDGEEERQRLERTTQRDSAVQIGLDRGHKRGREGGDDEREVGATQANADDPIKIFVNNLEILKLHGNVMTIHEEPDYQSDFAIEAYDDKTGELLDPVLVEKGRAEEIEFMKNIPLYDEAPISECLRETGKPPVGTKWVDVNKGSFEDPDVRCRLVARDFKPRGERDRCDLFAAMPPLEAKKLLFRKAAAQKRVWRRGGWRRMKLMFVDVKKAHLNGVLEPHEKAYVSLPEGCCQPGMCARLRRWLYGMRPAANAWERDFTVNLESIGFERGKSAPTAFYNPVNGVRCVVHGDDFTFLGFEEDLQDVARAMGSWYELKVRGVLGGEPGDLQEITILNRRLTWVGDVMTYEADPKHGEIICDELGLQRNSNGLVKAVVRETLEDIENLEDAEELNVSDGRRYRGITARANYLAQDRADLQYATKDACRSMSKPTIGSWKRLKRLARYILEYPRLIWRCGEVGEDEVNVLRVYSDSDWAGCLRTRKSTSGGVVTLGGMAIKHWSSTQSTQALSVGEAEYTALVKAATEALGMQALARDLGWGLRIEIFVDSTTAKSIANRSGIGKVRHLETKVLWIQEALKKKRFDLKKVSGLTNPADILTKPMSASEMHEKLAAIGASLKMRAPDARPRWADAAGDDSDDDVV